MQTATITRRPKTPCDENTSRAAHNSATLAINHAVITALIFMPDITSADRERARVAAENAVRPADFHPTYKAAYYPVLRNMLHRTSADNQISKAEKAGGAAAYHMAYELAYSAVRKSIT